MVKAYIIVKGKLIKVKLRRRSELAVSERKSASQRTPLHLLFK